MSRLVLDASVTVAWGLGDERSAVAESVLGAVETEGAVTPPIWPFEVTNALLAAERRGRASVAETERFLGLLRALPIACVAAPSASVLDGSTTLARQHRLSAYDVAYLQLAIRTGLPLATLDRALRVAARALGVPVTPSES